MFVLTNTVCLYFSARDCLEMDEEEISNLLADIKEHVAYSKTALAELIAERRNKISRYAKDKIFERQVAELQRRIGHLPRLITEAEKSMRKNNAKRLNSK